MYCYFYNVNSKNKVLHVDGCHYLSFTDEQNLRKKESIKKAVLQGFSLCKHCFNIGNRFNDKYQKFGKYGKNNYTYACGKDCLDITTGKGSWKVVYAQHKPVLELFHQNKEERPTDFRSRIPGYHYQYVSRYEFGDIIDYICAHDGKLKPPPAKGTRRYKEWQKHNKMQERRESINNVLRLIDSLHSTV